MSILGQLLGHASELKTEQIENDFNDILIDQENVQHAYKLIRDLIVFTNKRLILLDKQGFSGKKKAYLSIPYSSITRFSKESSGRFDMDAEIKLWLRGENQPLELAFKKDKSVHEIYRVLSQFVLA